MRNPTIALLPALLALALAACGDSGAASAADAATFTVKRGDLEITLTESGTLEARNKVDIRPNVKTGAKILSIVDEGTVVTEGQVLVELDKESTQKDIENLEDQVIQLETELKNAKTDADIQRQENESEIEQAKLKLEFAKLELERYEGGDHPQEERDLQLRIDRAESNLKQAEDRYSKIPKLLDAGFVTPVEAEEKRLALEEAKVEVESAKLALKLYQDYTYRMDLRQKKADVTEAERELSRVNARSEARLDSKLAVVRQKERQYDAAVQKLSEAKQELGNLTITAPQPGIVIYGGSRDRRGNVDDPVKVGATVFPGRTIIELPDLTKMDVTLQIHQADIGKVKKGQTAWVTVPGRRSGPLRATVSDIGSVAQSQNWRDPVRRFDVTVQIDEQVEGLRAGITAEVQIEVGEIQDVLYVPVQSVGSSGGGYFVTRMEDGEAKRRDVQLGRSNEQYVEVVSGLSEGDVISLVNAQVVSGGEKEEEGKPAGAGANGMKSGGPGGNGAASGRRGGGGGRGGQ